MEVTTLAEINATELFGYFNMNWKFCKKYAKFEHTEACEFILHIGDEDMFEATLGQMKEFGCTEDFIETYRTAKKAGAMRVCYYV